MLAGGLHDFLPPILLASAAWIALAAGLDERLADAAFDATLRDFPARQSLAIELLGHRLAKSAVLACWLLLVAAAIVAPRMQPLARRRVLLWTTVVAMAAGPAIVVSLKGMTAHHCPWDLKRYGGLADVTHAWFVRAAEAGRCFPSGHAAGGFSLLALYFAARAARKPRLARVALAVALAAGLGFAAVRMAQGAHFLSHNLWAAAIDWTAAALVFRVSSAMQGGPPRRVAA